MRWTVTCLLVAGMIASSPTAAWAGVDDDFKAAIEKLNFDAIERALDQGASPNVVVQPGIPALLYAILADRSDVARLLLDHGADVNARIGTGDLQGTALTFTAGSGAVSSTELLLSRGANVEATDSNGATPIEDAAGMGKLKMVALLAGAGANVNARAAEGYTPLHLAAWNGHGDVVRLLLALGADPSARNNAGQTPYDMAAQSDKMTASDKADVLASLAVPQSGNPSSATVPNCWDAEAIARQLIQGLPGKKWRPGELVATVEVWQKMHGCGSN